MNHRARSYLVLAITGLAVAGLIAAVLIAGGKPPSEPSPQSAGRADAPSESRPEPPSGLAAPTPEEIAAAAEAGSIIVELETTRGPITMELRGDLMPLTVANFVKLAKTGYYDGLTFHRVEDWVVQGGDPTGTGRGGPGYAIALETHPDMRNVRGAVAMARTSDPDSAGSQFYILRTDAAWLDGDYAVFGHVTEGMEAVDAMQRGDRMTSVKVVAAD